MQRIVMCIIAVGLVAGCEWPKVEKKDQAPTAPVEPEPLVPIKLKKKPKCTKKLPKVKALKPAFVLKVLTRLRKVGPSYPSKSFVQVLLHKGAAWRMVLDCKDRRYTIYSNVGLKIAKGRKPFVSIWIRKKGSGVSTFSDGPIMRGGITGVVDYGNHGKRYFDQKDCKGFKHMPYFHLQYRQTIFDLAKILHVSVN